MSNFNHRSVFGGEYLEFLLCGIVAPQLSQMVALGLAPKVAAGFLKEMTKDVLEDTENHAKGVDRLRVIVDSSGEVGAFAASNVRNVSIYKRDDSRVLHVGGIIVSPELQGKRVGTSLVMSEMGIEGANLLAFHTQNRHMLDLGEKVTQYSYALTTALADEFETANPRDQVIGGVRRVVQDKRYGQGSLYGQLRSDIAIKGLGRGGNAIFYVGERKR